MPKFLTDSRKKDLDASFEDRRPLLERAAQLIRCSAVVLTVGCEDGYFDLKMTKVFEPKRIILTDVKKSLEVSLPSNAEFQQADVCSHEFLRRFQNKPTLVLCSQTLHETRNVFQAAQNLFSVLPEIGTTLIWDYSEEGLGTAYKQSKKDGTSAYQHFVSDLVNLTRYGLHTNKGIKDFWEGTMFQKCPGETYLFFQGQMYMVVYIARQWGEVKPVPPELEAELRRLGYIK